MGRPFAAFKYMSKALGNGSEANFALPPFLVLHALCLLCQILYGVCRQGFGSEKVIDYEQILLKYGLVYVEKFLDSVKAPSTIQFNEFSYETVVQLLLFTCDEHKAVLAQRKANFVSNLAKRNTASLISHKGNEHLFSLNAKVRSRIFSPSQMDSVKTTLSVLSLTVAKASWHIAMSPDTGHMRRHWFLKGTSAIEYAICGLHHGADLFAPRQNASNEYRNAIRMGTHAYSLSVLVADHIEKTSSSEVDFGSSLVAGFLPLSVFNLLANLISVTDDIMTNNPEWEVSKELHDMLRLSSDRSLVQTIRDAMLSTSRTMIHLNLDTCSGCMDNSLARLRADPKFAVLIPSHSSIKDSEKVQNFPCLHGTTLVK
jgi:hypothetical protein